MPVKYREVLDPPFPWQDLVDLIAQEMTEPHESDAGGQHPLILINSQALYLKQIVVVWDRFETDPRSSEIDRIQVVRKAYRKAFGSDDVLISTLGYTPQEARSLGIHLD